MQHTGLLAPSVHTQDSNCTGDELEVFMMLRIIEVHFSELHIVSSNLEWDNLQSSQSWSHLKYLQNGTGETREGDIHGYTTTSR